MTMEIFNNIEQGTPDWHALRCGLVTASMFGTVMASGRGGGESKTRRMYMLKLAGELITGEQAEGYSNHHMERGKVMEDEARTFYSFMTDNEVEQVGFIRNGRKGCSPDSLIGEPGMLEIKTKLPHLAIDCILSDAFPAEHKAQVQGQLWVAEREWCDLCVYWPKLPPFIKRVSRDEPYIRKLSEAIDLFNEELDEVVSKIKAYGLKDAA
jgi:hypothetical protein